MRGITYEQARAKLQELAKSGDTEAAHSEADQVLCDFLIGQGFPVLVDEYNKVEKWYA